MSEIAPVVAAEQVATQQDAPVESPVVQEQVQTPVDTRDYDSEAREMGWVPKTEFKGEPEKWKPADQFVRDGEKILPIVRSQLKRAQEELARERAETADRLARMERMQRETLQRQKIQHDAELKRLTAMQRGAVEQGDTATWERLEAEKDALSKAAPPAFEERPAQQADTASIERAWVAQNPWYTENFEMARVANEYSQWLLNNNKAATFEDNLKQVDAFVRQKFPEKFGLARPAPVQNGHAAVDSGGAFPGATKPTGPSSKLKPHELAQAKADVAAKLYKNEDEWARVYFGN